MKRMHAKIQYFRDQLNEKENKTKSKEAGLNLTPFPFLSRSNHLSQDMSDSRTELQNKKEECNQNTYSE